MKIRKPFTKTALYFFTAASIFFSSTGFALAKDDVSGIKETQLLESSCKKPNLEDKLKKFGITDVGFDIFYGEDVKWNNSWKSKEYDFNVKGLTLRTGKYLDESEKWKLDLGLILGLHRAEGLGYYRDTRDTDCPFSFGKRHALTLGAELYLKREFKDLVSFLTPYLGLGGGFSYLTPRDNQPEWMNSGMLGTFGGCAGANIPIKDRWELRFETRITHTSDPLNHGDFGRNHHIFLGGLTYKFK